MSSKPTKPTTAIEAVPLLVDLLSGLSSDEQKRAISAAVILLGPVPNAAIGSGQGQPPDTNAEGISAKATAWLKKYSISSDQLGHVFTISSEEVDVIAASLPGDSKRQQTLEAYVLCGLRSFIRDGADRFDDRDARALCQKLGCYDSPNHSNYMKAFGNLLIGSKDTGWKLTNPGFERAAQIVKQLTETSP
jgi:hypothetical protein